MELRHHEADFLSATDNSEQQKILYSLIKMASNALSQYKNASDDSEWLLAKEQVTDYFALSEFDYNDIEEDAKETFKIQFG